QGLNPWADGYGVGTRIAGARVVDFAFDIVEIDGAPKAKRGKEAGAKKLMRCGRCFSRRNAPLHAKATRCACGGAMRNMHRDFMKCGRVVSKLPTVQKIRERTLAELKRVEL
ncbi:MAG: nicotinate phosphoribosyltransferase, partial [bacterium]